MSLVGSLSGMLELILQAASRELLPPPPPKPALRDELKTDDDVIHASQWIAITCRLFILIRVHRILQGVQLILHNSSWSSILVRSCSPCFGVQGLRAHFSENLLRSGEE